MLVESQDNQRAAIIIYRFIVAFQIVFPFNKTISEKETISYDKVVDVQSEKTHVSVIIFVSFIKTMFFFTKWKIILEMDSRNFPLDVFFKYNKQKHFSNFPLWTLSRGHQSCCKFLQMNIQVPKGRCGLFWISFLNSSKLSLIRNIFLYSFLNLYCWCLSNKQIESPQL